MILRMPVYCKEFRCIADKCTDCCCIGWEIDIDSRTGDFYETVPGAFGKRLQANITEASPKSFILDEHERCPFLNSRNLCDIIQQLGEAHLCQICRDHPRYYEWFDGLTEGGIGLCCEEAARIILSQTQPLTYWDREVPEEPADYYDTELCACLMTARERILAHLERQDIPLSQRISDVLCHAQVLQEHLDGGELWDAPIAAAPTTAEPDLPELLRRMQTLEPIDEKWIPYLGECAQMLDAVQRGTGDCSRAHPEMERYLQNIAQYFIWRYFCKGVFEEEILSKVSLMAVSVAVIGYLFVCRWLQKGSLTLEDCAIIAKNYSKEVEYSQENLDVLSAQTLQ